MPTPTPNTKVAAAGRAHTPPRAATRAQQQRSRRWLGAGGATLAVLGLLFAVFQVNGDHNTGASTPAYQVGSPGIGQHAPGFTLPSSAGGAVDLAGLQGKTVLLYFQEGVGCEPCWTQLKDLESQAGAVKAAGIDQVVSITTQPVNLLTQKAHDEGIRTPVLADTDLAVSKAYQANRYGMMGDGMDGHSFVLVGPGGTIQWRADYGGAPKYTMDVPVKQLLADLAGGRRT